MGNLLFKIASELDSAANKLEVFEKKEKDIKVAALKDKKVAIEKKRQAFIEPLKEKLSSLTEVGQEEVEKNLKTASMATLELLSKGFSTSAPKVDDSWGYVEQSKKGKGKYAGYADPIEAFALS